MTTTAADKSIAVQNDGSESTQLKNAQKQESLNRNVQDSVKEAADPSTWTSSSEDLAVSNVQTTGKNGLYQDQALPSGMNPVADASGENAMGQQSVDPMHQYMNDLNSLLNNSANLLGDVNNLTGSIGANPSAAQQQLETSAAGLEQSLMNFDTQMLQQFSQLLQGGTAGGGSDMGNGATTVGGGSGGGTGSDAGAGGTTAGAGSDGGAATTNTGGIGSDGGAGTTNTGGTGSDGGAGTTNTGGTGSDGGTGTTNTGGTGSDGGAGTTNTGGTGSDGGTGTINTGGTGSDGGTGTINTGGTGSDGGTGTINTGGTGSDGGTGTINTGGTGSDGGTGTINTGGTGSDTGNYSVVNGTIIGPNGQPFDAKGVAVYAPDLTQSQAAGIMQEMPDLNFIRLASDPSLDTPADVQADIQAFQSINPNVVVEVEDHAYRGGDNTPLEGAALTTEENWYSQIAAANVNNPNVWFGTANEPNDSSDEQKVVDQEVGIYNAIRGAGNNNMVMLEADGGGTFGPQQGDTGAYAAMNNVAWDIHFYGGVTNGDTSVSDNVAAIQSEMGAANGITESNGSGGQQNIPVIVGEYGDSINGQAVDSNGTAAVDAVQTANNEGLVQGAVAWIWDGNYNPNDAVTLDGTPSTITPYGQEIINYVNNDSSGSVT